MASARLKLSCQSSTGQVGGRGKEMEGKGERGRERCRTIKQKRQCLKGGTRKKERKTIERKGRVIIK